MDLRMERWYSATGQRFSARKYNGKPDGDELLALEETARLLSAKGVRVAIGADKRVFSSNLFTYGRFTGAECFAAFIASENAELETVGYMGEAFILEAAAMGLGTCWIGMYNKRAVREIMPLGENERLCCITPIGVSAEEYVGRPRKPLDKLTGLDQQSLIDLPEWQQRALECARLAPSAMNRQALKYTIEKNNIVVEKTSGNFGYSEIDMGIAMLHIELGASHCGVLGDWENQDGAFVFMPRNEAVNNVSIQNGSPLDEAKPQAPAAAQG